MQRNFSAIFGVELSTFGKLFNTKAVISFRKEYEREEDKKVQSYSSVDTEVGENSEYKIKDEFIQDARYEMVAEQQTKIHHEDPNMIKKKSLLSADYKETGNKYLNTYLRTQHTSYPYRGNILDFRI